jgi:hypothetical protein
MYVEYLLHDIATDWRPIMAGPRSHGLPSPRICAWIVVAMLAMIAIPAAITLRSVHQPAPLIPVNQNSTPHGYTFSLLLFIIPSAVIGGWFLPREGLHIPQRAFYWTTNPMRDRVTRAFHCEAAA